MHPLDRAEDNGDASPIDPHFPGRYFVDPTCRSGETDQTILSGAFPGDVITARYQLPSGVTCSHCVVQMVHYTGNSCMHPGYEEFNPPSWPSKCAPNKGDWILTGLNMCGVGDSYPEGKWPPSPAGGVPFDAEVARKDFAIQFRGTQWDKTILGRLESIMLTPNQIHSFQVQTACEFLLPTPTIRRPFLYLMGRQINGNRNLTDLLLLYFCVSSTEYWNCADIEITSDVGKRRWLARGRVLLPFGSGWYDYTYLLPRTSPSSNLGRSSTAFICRPCTDGTPSDPAPVPAPAPEAETPAPVGDELINLQTFAPFFDSSTMTETLAPVDAPMEQTPTPSADIIPDTSAAITDKTMLETPTPSTKEVMTETPAPTPKEAEPFSEPVEPIVATLPPATFAPSVAATELPPDECEDPVAAYSQCGGTDYEGSTCCRPGYECTAIADCFSECHPIENTCSKGWGQCGGNNWEGPTCCWPGAECLERNEWYSQCVPNANP
ncbi:unnamed protein product [Ascophyllum nodosum]